ncbi:MAG: chemotaxis protein CheD [Verrucomicrobiota bacterium]|nr:chemotaxis protein CheD [Verrucomicrobiota bacterium]
MPVVLPVNDLFRQTIVIGVGHSSVGNNPNATLITYALGSCIGMVVYAAGINAGGILHYMLPDSTLSPEKAVAQPAMFADTGLPHFLRSLKGIQATPANLKCALFGGAAVLSGEDYFKVGERNIAAARVLTTIYRLRVVHSAVGGNYNRTVSLNLATGLVTVKTPNGVSTVSLA